MSESLLYLFKKRRCGLQNTETDINQKINMQIVNALLGSVALVKLACDFDFSRFLFLSSTIAASSS